MVFDLLKSKLKMFDRTELLKFNFCRRIKLVIGSEHYTYVLGR